MVEHFQPQIESGVEQSYFYHSTCSITILVSCLFYRVSLPSVTSRFFVYLYHYLACFDNLHLPLSHNLKNCVNWRLTSNLNKTIVSCFHCKKKATVYDTNSIQYRIANMIKHFSLIWSHLSNNTTHAYVVSRKIYLCCVNLRLCLFTRQLPCLIT